MARVVFTPNLQRHVDCPPQDVEARTVREALAVVFRKNPRLRGYVWDDQEQIRQHIVVFVDGRPVVDRVGLSDRVDAAGEVYVLQALSGG